MHRGTIGGSLAALLALSGCEQSAPELPGPAPSCSAPAPVTAPFVGPVCAACTADPVNDPYTFAWQLFATLSVGAPRAAFTSNASLWETWADDLDTFPASPDPKRPPVWPGDGAGRAKVLRAPGLQRRLAGRRPEARAGSDADATEEVRRNEPAFRYIADNGLYYVEGIEAALACAHARGAPLAFPRSAIEVKASWKPIAEDQAARYHWSRDSGGHLHGLVAMHLSSKALPNWFWATFEHVDNPGRCDDIGCRDDFGADPAFVPPAPPTAACQTYPAGAPTAALVALLTSLGLGPEWQSYRLKGVQIDFTDAMGRPTRLGNSVTEDGFVMTASCMTCHARAAMDRAGGFLPLFSTDPPSPGQKACGGAVHTAYVGAPSPGWFGGGDATEFTQGDFVWALGDASPAGP